MSKKEFRVEGSYEHTLTIPREWSFTPFNNVIEIVGGSQPPKSEFSSEQRDGFIRLIQIRDYKSNDNLVYIPIEKAKRFVSTDDIMIGRYGPPIFQILRGLEGAYNVALMKAKPVANLINKNFLFYYLRNRDLYNYVEAASDRTAGQSGVNKAHLEKYPVGLPPLAEQQVIADTLDALLTQVETTKTRLERVPETIKRFRQSVLAAAVSGKLTEEWRGSKPAPFAQPPITIGQEKSEFPDGWEWNNLIDLARLESGHTPRKSVQEYWESGDVPWISLQDIRAAHGTVIAKTKFMPTRLGIENSSARLLPKGTVCFSRDISVGYTTIMGAEMATTQHFVNWICTEELNNHYLMYAFMAAKDHLTISGQGTTVKTLYMPACKQFRLLTPPLPEQQEIVRRVEELFTHADAVEQQAKAALEKVNNLTQSILAKAFRGELTADWRAANPELISGDNSAEALLARIKEERAAQKPKKRGTRKRTS